MVSRLKRQTDRPVIFELKACVALAVVLVSAGCGSGQGAERAVSTLPSTAGAAWVAIPADAVVVGSAVKSAGDPTFAPVTLASRPGTPLGSELSPLAAPYGDGVLYLAAPKVAEFIGGGLRLAGPSQDRLVDEHAASFSVSADGRIAVGRLTDKGSEIVVLDDADSKPQPWASSVQPLVALAWSGHQLLVLETFGESGVAPNLLSIAGPGDVRRVREASSLLAVSPDGQSLLVDSLNSKTSMNEAVILASDTFQQVGQLRPADRSAELVVGQAEWSAAGIVATVWIDGDQQISVFAPVGADFATSQLIPLPKEVQFGLVHPTYDATSGTVWGWAWDNRVVPTAEGSFQTSPYLLVKCNLKSASCVGESVGGGDGQVSRVFSRSSQVATVEES